jgi:murein endopeptidase
VRGAVFGLAAVIGLVGLAGVVALAALASGVVGTSETDGPRDGRERRGGGQETEVGQASTEASAQEASSTRERVRWRESEALGIPSAGRLVNGVRLPQDGEVFFTWDPVRKEVPNRNWRLWGTDRAVRMTLQVVRDLAGDDPAAPRVGIGDLSRRNGGDFGAKFGKLGHASHQNGLDIDVYYPRLDRSERRARKPSQVDHAYAQDLVDRFVAAGAEKLFVGPSLGLTGPRGVVIPLVNHDDHVHVRLPASPSPLERT